jgi:uncharacterized protein YodC (DUF2158 family)
MAQSIFKAGDMVTLKSGGPVMTIKEVKTKQRIAFDSVELEINKVIAQWFNEKDEMVEGEFTEPQLNKVE